MPKFAPFNRRVRFQTSRTPQTVQGKVDQEETTPVPEIVRAELNALPSKLEERLQNARFDSGVFNDPNLKEVLLRVPDTTSRREIVVTIWKVLYSRIKDWVRFFCDSITELDSARKACNNLCLGVGLEVFDAEFLDVKNYLCEWTKSEMLTRMRKIVSPTEVESFLEGLKQNLDMSNAMDFEIRWLLRVNKEVIQEGKCVADKAARVCDAVKNLQENPKKFSAFVDAMVAKKDPNAAEIDEGVDKARDATGKMLESEKGDDGLGEDFAKVRSKHAGVLKYLRLLPKKNEEFAKITRDFFGKTPIAKTRSLQTSSKLSLKRLLAFKKAQM